MNNCASGHSSFSGLSVMGPKSGS